MNISRGKIIFIIITILISFISASPFGYDTDETSTVTVNTFTGNLTNLSEMQDVNIPSPSDNEVLTWSTANGVWESATGTSSDSSWVANYTNLVANNCAPNFATGMFENGTFQCGISSATDATWVANWTAYNDTWSSTTNLSYLLNIGDIGVGNYSFNGGNFSINNTAFFYDSNLETIGIGTSSNMEHTLEIIGQVGITRVADDADQHALEIIANASGFGDFKAILIDYITGAISGGQDEEAILINIDDFLATGGDVVGLEVVTTEGGSKVIGLEVGVLVNPIEQLSGIFEDMDSANVIAVDRLSEFTSTASDIDIFVNNLDNITIGNSVKFEEIEFILDTVASGAGVNPEFWFSTGIGTWAQFNPSDGTNGFRNTGVVLWLDSDIPTWETGTGSEYLILINRTQVGLATNPIENLVQIASATEFFWDKDGFISANNISLVDNVTANFFIGNGSQLTDITLTETDPLWTSNYTNQIADSCGSDFVTGIFDNGTFRCAVASASDATWLANWTAYNDTWSSTTNTSYALLIELNNGTYTNTTNSSYLLNTGDTATGNYTFGSDNFIIDSTLNRIVLSGNETSATIAGTEFGSKLTVHSEGATDLLEFFLERHTDTAGFGAFQIFARSRGTELSETVVQDGDLIGRIAAIGHDGTDFGTLTRIDFEVDGTPIAGSMPGRIIFQTSLNGTESPIERMRIDNAGLIGINITAPQNLLHIGGDINFTGLIYGNGSQLTDITLAESDPLAYNGTLVDETRLNNGTYIINSVLNNGTYVTNLVLNNGSYLNIAETDPFWLANYTNLVEECGANSYAFGIFDNGTFECRIDQTSAGGNTTEEIQDAVGSGFGDGLDYDDTNGFFNHSDFTAVANSTNSGNTFIQDITFDNIGLGHVVTIVTGVVDVITSVQGFFDQEGELNTTGNPTFRNITLTGNLSADFLFGNGSQLTDITLTETDPLWTSNYTNQIADSCGSDFVTGIFENGTFRCAVASSTDASWVANWTAYNTTWSTDTIDTTWLANWTAYNTTWTTTDIEIWNIAGNGTLVEIGALNNGTYVTNLILNNGSYLNVAETDPLWTANYTNQIADDCGSDFVTGIFENGTFRCTVSSASDATWIANWTAYNTTWSTDTIDTTWLVNWTAYNTTWSTDTSASVDCSGTNVLLGNGTCIETVLLDVFVDTAGDTMTGDLNVSIANITITVDTGRYCLTQNCVSYIFNNGTHSIWK